KIVEAAEKGELTELVLMVIWNRRDLAQRDHQGRIGLPPEGDVLLRIDFVREVDTLLQEVRAEQSSMQPQQQGLDPESVANRLKQQEKQQTIRQVEALLELAISLKW
ncbi:Protein PALE CRESS, chloroplastic, partial [Ananas comosus]